eukprot:scaffold13576_cov125-Isochrysis_galbana.AAC.6
MIYVAPARAIASRRLRPLICRVILILARGSAQCGPDRSTEALEATPDSARATATAPRACAPAEAFCGC